MNRHFNSILRKLSGNALERETKNWDTAERNIPKGKRKNHEGGGFSIYDDQGNEVYLEFDDGDWEKYKYDERHNLIYQESSDGYWEKLEYDERGNHVYSEDSDGHWHKWKFDNEDVVIEYENSSKVKNVAPKTKVQSKPLPMEQVWVVFLQDNYQDADYYVGASSAREALSLAEEDFRGSYETEGKVEGNALTFAEYIGDNLEEGETVEEIFKSTPPNELPAYIGDVIQNGHGAFIG